MQVVLGRIEFFQLHAYDIFYLSGFVELSYV